MFKDVGIVKATVEEPTDGKNVNVTFDKVTSFGPIKAVKTSYTLAHIWENNPEHGYNVSWTLKDSPSLYFVEGSFQADPLVFTKAGVRHAVTLIEYYVYINPKEYRSILNNFLAMIQNKKEVVNTLGALKTTVQNDKNHPEQNGLAASVERFCKKIECGK